MSARKPTRRDSGLFHVVTAVLSITLMATLGAFGHRWFLNTAGRSADPSVADPSVAAPTTTFPAPPAGVTIEQQLMVRKVSDAIVQVSTERCHDFGNGSGVLLGPDLVVTAAHVVADGRHFYVTGRVAQLVAAELVAYAPQFDLAVLRVPGLSAVTPPGLAIGPLSGRGVALTRGRDGVTAHPYQVVKQVVATIPRVASAELDNRSVLVLAARLEPGDSGGPLIDDVGRVAGIAFGIEPGNQSVAYATPASSVRTVLESVGQPVNFTAPVCE